MVVDSLGLRFTWSMFILAIKPFLPLLFPIRMIFHHPKGELQVRYEAGFLLTNYLMMLVLIALHLADILILGSLVAILFLVTNFLAWMGSMVTYPVDTLTLGSLVAILLFSPKFYSL